MLEALWLIVATVVSVGGMAGLALSMELHWGQVMRRLASEAVGVRFLCGCWAPWPCRWRC